MFDGLFIVSILASYAKGIKEALEHTIPAENWKNKKLFHQDMVDGVPIEQRMKNLKNGKYKLSHTYPNPHRNPVNGKIVIENETLYHKDVRDYGAYQAQKWVQQGKYNLTREEFEKERERHRKELERLYGRYK